MWWRFGTFPRHFLLTNLLAVPLTGALLVASLLLLPLSAAGCCPHWGFALVDTLATGLTQILSVIAGL